MVQLRPSAAKEREYRKQLQGFPGGSVIKNPPAKAGDLGSISDPGRFYMLQSNSAHVPPP